MVTPTLAVTEISVPPTSKGTASRALDAISDRRRDRLAADVGADDHELVAAKASERVAWPYHRLQSRSEHPKDIVSCRVAMTIVDVLEVVEIEEQDCHKCTTSLRACKGSFDPIVEQQSVGQLGQRVVEHSMLQLPFDLFALADVTRDRRNAYETTRSVTDSRDRHRDVNEAPVLASPDALVMLDALSRAQAPEHIRQFVIAIPRNEHRNVLPQHLLRGVAVEVLRSGVPTQNRPIKGLTDDRIV